MPVNAISRIIPDNTISQIILIQDYNYLIENGTNTIECKLFHKKKKGHEEIGIIYNDQTNIILNTKTKKGKMPLEAGIHQLFPYTIEFKIENTSFKVKLASKRVYTSLGLHNELGTEPNELIDELFFDPGEDFDYYYFKTELNEKKIKDILKKYKIKLNSFTAKKILHDLKTPRSFIKKDQ